MPTPVQTYEAPTQSRRKVLGGRDLASKEVHQYLRNQSAEIVERLNVIEIFQFKLRVLGINYPNLAAKRFYALKRRFRTTTRMTSVDESFLDCFKRELEILLYTNEPPEPRQWGGYYEENSGNRKDIVI